MHLKFQCEDQTRYKKSISDDARIQFLASICGIWIGLGPLMGFSSEAFWKPVDKLVGQ